MEIFLVILMVLAIFVVIPAIIGFIIVGVYSGLFQVVRDRLRKRVAVLRTKPARTVEETAPQRII